MSREIFLDRKFSKKIRKFFIEDCMKMKIFEIKNFRNFRSQNFWKIFIENCMKMKIFEIENFRFFSISKIFIFIRSSMKNFGKWKIFRTQKISSVNFKLLQKLSFSFFFAHFFIDRYKISPRSRFISAKSAENATGKS